MAGLGFCGYSLARFFDFAGLQHISASLERLIVHLNPTLVRALSVLLFSHRARPAQGLALAVSCGGVLRVFGHELRDADGNTALGAALVFGSAVSGASARCGSPLAPR